MLAFPVMGYTQVQHLQKLSARAKASKSPARQNAVAYATEVKLDKCQRKVLALLRTGVNIVAHRVTTAPCVPLSYCTLFWRPRLMHVLAEM